MSGGASAASVAGLMPTTSMRKLTAASGDDVARRPPSP